MQNGLPTKANLYHRRSSIKIPNFNADARVVCCQEGVQKCIQECIYSKTQNYLYIGEVRKPRQRESGGIVIH